MESKTFVFPEGNGGNSVDPNLLLSSMNNGGFGGNGGGWWIWLLFLWFMRSNGWNGDNNVNGQQYLMDAIQGNGNAINQLAASLNTSTGMIQQSLCGLGSQIQSVGNQVGMSGQQVINAIQSGNMGIAQQLASCCCEVREGITKSNYDNQIATLNQTNVLGSKIDGSTASVTGEIASLKTAMIDHFCDLEKRELQNKIDALREERSTLQGQISNANQTAQVAQLIANATTPIANAVNALQGDVNCLKCKCPETVTVPANNGVYVPACAATQLGLGFGFGTLGNGSLWS